MCGPFKSMQGILRLLEIIFSSLAFFTAIARGAMWIPWGIWCEFVWFFCIIIPLILVVMEATSLKVLMAAFLPNWDDLCCGLTLLCAVMIISATVAFGAVFLCLSCITSIMCFIFSLIATGIFLVDGIMQKIKCPSGYFSSVRGILRTAEAFIACLIITAAYDFFVRLQWPHHPIGAICSVVVFAVCLIITVFIIILNLFKILHCLVPCGLNKVELVFDIVALLLYLLAIILWGVFAYKHYYKRYSYNHDFCYQCAFKDLNAVTVGAIINFILYIVDLVLAFKAR